MDEAEKDTQISWFDYYFVFLKPLKNFTLTEIHRTWIPFIVEFSAITCESEM